MGDWYPTKRQKQLDMAKNWLDILNEDTPPPQGGGGLTTNWRLWGIPESTINEFGKAYDEADQALETAKNVKLRTTVIDTAVTTTFTALESIQRFIKRRFFFMPPLTPEIFRALQLNIPDSKPTTILAPLGEVEGSVSWPGPHLIQVHLRPVAGTPQDPRADYGYRIYYGIMPPGGATTEEALSTKRSLMKVPLTGEELPHSKFTHRKNEIFDLGPENSGKTVYFCVRYENSKGASGPWGPIFSAIIP